MPSIRNVRFTSLPADHRPIPLAVAERPPLSSPLLTWSCWPPPEWFRCPHTPRCWWHTVSLHTQPHERYIGHDIQGLTAFRRCKISISWKVWPFPLGTKFWSGWLETLIKGLPWETATRMRDQTSFWNLSLHVSVQNELTPTPSIGLRQPSSNHCHSWLHLRAPWCWKSNSILPFYFYIT